jgi:hypothetical protein
MQWSKLRIRVEELLADSVKGRVGLHSTRYRHVHDGDGRDWITLDGQELVNMPHWYRWTVRHGVNCEAAVGTNSEKLPDYDSLFRFGGLGRAMFEYLTLSIDDILISQNVLIRAIGMLDRRVGKRRLKGLVDENAHPLIGFFHRFRCDAEGVALPDLQITAQMVNLRRPASSSSVDPGEKRRRADAALQTKKKRHPRTLIERIYRNEIVESEPDTEVARQMREGFNQAQDRDVLLDMLCFIESKSKLMESAVYVRGVIQLVKDAEFWIRPLKQWIPRSHNPDRQFSSLARHLWAAYDVPVFMDKAWLQGTVAQQQWFKHVGTGKNMRTAEGIPIPLTKKMAHCFLEAPDHYSIEAAFRWAQVFALEGSAHLADALRETRIAREFHDNDFWLSVIRFFIRNPMLDLVHVNPIVDYIWNQRYEPRIVFVERGVAREAGPEQPNLSMKGRTVTSLLRDVEQWHKRLGRETQGGQLHWRKSAIPDFRFVEGTEQSNNMKVWKIRELLSSNELIAEGRRMRHCVASFARSCHNGTCSIWSMDVETEEGVTALLTVEVNAGTKEIRQVRGKHNRRATEKELDILRRWTVQERLGVASYV